MRERGYKTEAERARAQCGPGGILALDLAGLTGCAFGQLGGEPTWWSERVAGEGSSSGAVFTRFDAWMTHLLHILAPKRVYAELAFINPHMPNAVMRLAGYKAIVQKCCFSADRWLKFVPPAEITAYFTGSGHWAKGQKKSATIEVCKSLGWDTYSTDEADALALFVFAERDMGVDGNRLKNTLQTKKKPVKKPRKAA